MVHQHLYTIIDQEVKTSTLVYNKRSGGEDINTCIQQEISRKVKTSTL